MANGILKNLNQSLEIILRDTHDGMKEFTLAMAASSLHPKFEILPAVNKPGTTEESQATMAPALNLVDTHATEPLPNMCKQRRAGNAG